jgi:hypothetical protein
MKKRCGPVGSGRGGNKAASISRVGILIFPNFLGHVWPAQINEYGRGI